MIINVQLTIINVKKSEAQINNKVLILQFNLIKKKKRKKKTAQ